ncbi:hypothetical protein, partial [Escherichia coli]|uniref:hypothetical protein n=1 Tax=Escherichia coli TaxID=562 RepID=UPI00112418BE
RTSGEKRVFLVILFTSFSGSLVSRISGAVQHSGDRLIVEGSAKVTSGQTVKAVEVQANGGNA